MRLFPYGRRGTGCLESLKANTLGNGKIADSLLPMRSAQQPMATTLKQRLTGGLVLLATGLILWPLLFDDPYSRRIDTETRISEAPPLTAEPIVSPQPLHQDLPLETGLYAPEPEAVVPDDSESQKAAPAVPVQSGAVVQAEPVSDGRSLKHDERGLPQRWTIQIANLLDAQAAQQLLERLQAQGHPAYLKPATIGDKASVRVFVGPKLDRAEADTLSRRINREFSLASIVVRFDP